MNYKNIARVLCIYNKIERSIHTQRRFSREKTKHEKRDDEGKDRQAGSSATIARLTKPAIIIASGFPMFINIVLLPYTQRDYTVAAQRIARDWNAFSFVCDFW